ncbi:N-acetylglucosamine-6-phosphate deacetylase [Eubacteriales bacterium OttesenSCG-928-M02]|nr:N-acetylglucosamine-6-phosphate deacetylase [Eubacteriales bacterium OttesenSCG-928-M02]
MNNTRALYADTVIDGYRTIPQGVVLIADGRILAVGPRNHISIPPGAASTDYGPLILSPGFLDIHIHGARAKTVDDSLEDALFLTEYAAQHGNTGILITSTVLSGAIHGKKAMEHQAKNGCTGAVIEGIHMEGPFLSPKDIPGMAQLDKDLIEPSVEAFAPFWDAAGDAIRIVAMGIDRPGAFPLARHLRDKGILVACAHTKAGYDTMLAAMEHGFTHITHLYNIMTGLHHRRPGVTGAALTNDMLSCELICDTYHVHPAAMEIAIRCKGIDNIAMVSDHLMGGLPDGDHYWESGAGWITVTDGQTRIKGADPTKEGTMAGSCYLQDKGIHTLTHVLGYPIHQAVRMATVNPAKMAGLSHRIGSLEVGKDANITVFDEDINIVETIVRGNTVYRA